MRIIVKQPKSNLTFELYPESKKELRVLWEIGKKDSELSKLFSNNFKDLLYRCQNYLPELTDKKEIEFFEKNKFFEGILFKTDMEIDAFKI